MKYILLLIVVFSVSCSNKTSEKASSFNAIEILNDSIKRNIEANKDILDNSSTYSFINDSTLLSVSGDFDGDGIRETLYEHYFSNKLKTEVKRPHVKDDYSDFEDGSFFDRVIDLEPISFMTCSNNRIDTLRLSDATAQLGLYYVKNEGDLDGDGGDEISIIMNWLQYSTTTFCSIYSYKSAKWIELYSFSTWTWTVDEQADKGGLIRKISNNKIEIKYRTDEAFQDTMIIDLRNLKVSKEDSVIY